MCTNFFIHRSGVPDIVGFDLNQYTYTSSKMNFYKLWINHIALNTMSSSESRRNNRLSGTACDISIHKTRRTLDTWYFNSKCGLTVAVVLWLESSSCGPDVSQFEILTNATIHNLQYRQRLFMSLSIISFVDQTMLYFD